MKTLRFTCCLPLLCLLLTSLTAQPSDEWHWQRPLPQGNTLTAVAVPSPGTIVAGTDVGTILRLTDNAATWEVQSNVSGDASRILGLEFFTATVGLYTTEQGVYRTTDAGRAWEPVALPQESSRYYLFVADGSVAYIAAQEGAFFTTTDAGVTWSVSQIDDDHWRDHTISFGSPLKGVVGGRNVFTVYTEDGGESWTRVEGVADHGLEIIEFVTDDLVFALEYGAFSNNVYRSTDAGATWTENKLSEPRQLLGLTFLDEQTGIAVGLYGVLLRTTDGGDSWESLESNTTMSLFQVQFDGTDGIIVGEGGVVLRSEDRGETWAHVYRGLNEVHYGVDYYDEMNGLVVGEGGTILRTENGGVDWERNFLGDKVRFNAVRYSDAETAFIVGDKGRIFRSSDGGWSWNRIESGTDLPLFDIAFTDDNIGVIVGEVNVTFRSVDGGATWERVETGNVRGQYGIAFAGPVGISAGLRHKTMRTTDYGLSWDTLSLGVQDGVFGSVATNGSGTWIVAQEEGKVFRSTDNGETWVLEEERNSGIDEVVFISETEALAVGRRGMIDYSSDGGRTWTALTRFTNNRLYDIAVTPGGTLTAVGTGGTILSTNSGGTSSVTTRGGMAADMRVVLRKNPVVDHAEIVLSLASAEHVRLTVHDIQGHELAVVYEGDLPFGEHTFHWSTTDRASGMYLYRIETPADVADGQFAVVR